ncbi:B3 domain-containing transcription factor LEC2-like [Rosa rugosa]|uniref:B3 domain-containing transcription factor LEC2-like n=1 Tax=Rosa rugosa TaxID=74645 RepID=UPI002B405B0E|nr:B3 domain-containing transcription factor LEC2-like [Rosa rugosa]XP_062013125.1 B3 domain-containing transcription factor LEC2-like [Rosa rugosa]XP_062013126.1 B3 domain-containing transcription factor LEC2-like [Rosa rugosa]XP_062013127.1 B3 domain-containing transcription factor LEC2-like [Rosa rugosa]
MARQKRRLNLSTRNDAHAASASSRMGGERDATGAGSDAQNNEPDLYLFCTPDNRKLRFLFKKELKKSDIGSWGRIVLPKKEAEKYLPSLSGKEGIELMIKDALSNQEWGLTNKHRYWTNNNSRMYVLEHIQETL